MTLAGQWFLRRWDEQARERQAQRDRERERKNALNLVTSYVLLIHHNLRSLEVVPTTIGDPAAMSPREMANIRQGVQTFFKQTEDLFKQFNEAVDHVAKFEPYLGFVIRTRSFTLPAIQNMQSRFKEGPDTLIRMWQEVEAGMINSALESSEALLRILAEHSDPSNKEMILEYLEQKPARSSELGSWVDLLRDLQRQSRNG